ncbi:MAG TPA: cupin domain-containing protein [Vicinamibacterales bacterium]|nr:cupin domain-containing protein [Vicinamibacterales bacterium]
MALMVTDSVTSGERVRYGAGGGIYKIVATPAETGNTHFAFEAIEPPGGGPPLHIHTREEEYFLVLEGEITFYIGDQVKRGRAGESAFVPRGVPHCFKNCSDQVARLLVLFTPGEIEGFFEYGAAVDGGAPTEEVLLARLVELAPKFGLEVVGPSPL